MYEVLTGFTLPNISQPGGWLPLVFSLVMALAMLAYVILDGYDEQTGQIDIADPLLNNPTNQGQHYQVDFSRLINAIMLGIVTYDSNLLIIEPRTKQ